MFSWVKCWLHFKSGSYKSKTRSLCHILQKSWEHSRDNTAATIFMKLYQNASMKSWNRLKLVGYVGSKMRSLSQILKTPCGHSKRLYFFAIYLDQSSWNLIRMFAWWNLRLVWNWVTWSHKLCFLVNSQCYIIYNIFLFQTVAIKLNLIYIFHQQLISVSWLSPIRSGISIERICLLLFCFVKVYSFLFLKLLKV